MQPFDSLPEVRTPRTKGNTVTARWSSVLTVSHPQLVISLSKGAKGSRLRVESSQNALEPTSRSEGFAVGS
jgi:hypothetical protein